MNHSEYKELLSAFLDGELSGAEREDVLAHLDACEACRTYLAELTALRDALNDLEGVDVPDGFAKGVLARLHEEPAEKSAWTAEAPKRRTWRRWAGFAACAAVVLLAGSLWRFTHMGMGMNASGTSDTAAPSYYTGSSESSSFLMADDAPAAAGMAEPAEYAEDAAADGGGIMEYMAETALEEDEDEYAPIPGAANGEIRKWDAVDAPEHIDLVLSGRGAAEYLLANGAEPGEFDGEYFVDVSVLRDLPEGLALGGAHAYRAAEMDGVTVLVHVEAEEELP